MFQSTTASARPSDVARGMVQPETGHTGEVTRHLRVASGDVVGQHFGDEADTGVLASDPLPDCHPHPPEGGVIVCW